MIKITHRGNFNNTDRLLYKNRALKFISVLTKYADEGVKALEKNTPVDTGLTSKSWKYEIKSNKSGYQINWYNTNVKDGVSIALLLQYGHGTPSGKYIQGLDYINPAIRPIFDSLSEKIWSEVIK